MKSHRKHPYIPADHVRYCSTCACIMKFHCPNDYLCCEDSAIEVIPFLEAVSMQKKHPNRLCPF